MFKNLPFGSFFYSALALGVLSLVFSLIAQRFLPPVVPLLYGLPSGADELIPSWLLIIAPGISLLITGLNIFLALKLKDKFIKTILSTSALLLAVLSTITVLKIVFLVGF